MKVDIINFMHESNGIAIELTADTPAEQAILRAGWKFGRLGSGHGKSTQGNSLVISMFNKNLPAPADSEVSKMIGKQRTIFNALISLVEMVADGNYGRHDELNSEELCNDMDAVVLEVRETLK